MWCVLFVVLVCVVCWLLFVACCLFWVRGRRDLFGVCGVWRCCLSVVCLLLLFLVVCGRSLSLVGVRR